MKKMLMKRMITMAIMVFSMIILSACGGDQTTTVPTTPPEAQTPPSSTGNEYNTISVELLKKAATLPQISNDKLPDWQGIALVPEYLGRSPKPKDIEDIAKAGFNYVRVHYGYKSIVNEYDVSKPKENTLNQLDNIIGWGIENDVHINIVLYELPGSRDDIMKNSEHYRQAIEVWRVIAKRYANVPAAVLSYNLLNEPGYDVFTQEEYAKFANELADAIWSYDDKKVILSDGMLGSGWDGSVASDPIDALNPKMVQSLHFYPWHSLRRSAHMSLFQWPYQEGLCVNNTVSSEGEPMRILGDFPGGSEVTLYLEGIDNINNGGLLTFLADGEEVGQYSLEGITQGKDNCSNIFQDEGNPSITKAEFGDNGNYDGLKISFKLERAAAGLEIKVSGEDYTRVYMREILIKIPTSTESYYPVVNNWKKPQGFSYEKGFFRTVYIPCANVFAEQSSTVTVAEDGSCTSTPKFSDVDVFDLESMENYFAKWKEWSDRTGSRIMCNEFSIPIALPKEQRMAFLQSLLELFDTHDLPWAIHCERTEGFGPIVWQDELNSGALVLPPDNSYVEQEDYYIDQPGLDLIGQYTTGISRE